ncbi:MAG: hypothetical protein ACLRFL_03020 [Clostridia bacterium]
MILYFSIIIPAIIIISFINILLGTSIWGLSPYFSIVAVIATTLFQFLIDGLFAFIVNKLPNKWFAMDKKCFQVSDRSRKFYEALKIRKWKDKVWELGGLGGFRKNKLNDPKSPEYIERFIVESNKGIVTHRIGYFVGFIGIFLFPLKYALLIGVPVAVVNLTLNILPTMILRYNVPKLMILHTRLTRKKDL